MSAVAEMDSAKAQFCDAMRQRGLIPPSRFIADGQIHRCNVDGKNGKSDGAYLLHLDGIPAGGFENHRDGMGWESWRADLGRSLTLAEKAAQRQKIVAMRQAREAEVARLHAVGKAKARTILGAAKPVTGDHPYEVRKKISASAGVRRGLWPQRNKKDCLLIPMYDSNGALWNLQAIFPEKDQELGRDKDFIYGARKAGLHFVMGEIVEGVTVYVAEGYATAASVHAAMNAPVIVAFDAGNMAKIKLPPLPLAREVVIAADNDANGTGQRAADAAALRWVDEGRHVRIAMPSTPGQDFNDLLGKVV